MTRAARWLKARKPRARRISVGGRYVGVLGRRGGVRVVELDLARAARRVAEALAADVVRDLDQPVVRRVRALAALEGAVGVEEGRLGDVFRVGLVVEDGEGVAVDGVDVLAVEPLEGAVCRRDGVLRGEGSPPAGCRSCADLAVCARPASCGWNELRRYVSLRSQLARSRNSFRGRLEAGWRVELLIPSQGGDVGVGCGRLVPARDPSRRERRDARSSRRRGASGADGSPARARRDPLP